MGLENENKIDIDGECQFLIEELKKRSREMDPKELTLHVELTNAMDVTKWGSITNFFIMNAILTSHIADYSESIHEIFEYLGNLASNFARMSKFYIFTYDWGTIDAALEMFASRADSIRKDYIEITKTVCDAFSGKDFSDHTLFNLPDMFDFNDRIFLLIKDMEEYYNTRKPKEEERMTAEE